MCDAPFYHHHHRSDTNTHTLQPILQINSTEPLWAALFGAAVLGEKLDGLGYFGGLIILGGCLLTQAKLPPAMQARLEAVFGPGDDGGEGEVGGEKGE